MLPSPTPSDSSAPAGPDAAGAATHFDALPNGLWDQIAAGLCLVDAAGKILRVNRTFAMAVGFPPDELVGEALLRLYAPGSAPAMITIHRSLVAGEPEDRWLASPMSFQHRRGRPVAAYARNARVVEPDGTVRRLITLLDYAELARDDAQLQSLHRLQNFTALASAISNDFNNLLSIMLGYTSLLHDGPVDGRRSKIVAEGVEGAVQRASNLVRQTLYLARRTEPVKTSTDLGRFIEDSIRRMRPVLGDRVIAADLSFNREMREVPLDAVQMGDAIDELIGRIQVSDPDGTSEVRVGTRRLSGDRVRERFATAPAEAYALVEVMHKYMVRRVSSGPFPGLGVGGDASRHDLGLTMVERILDGHGGFLGVEESKSTGVRFSVYLPLSNGEEPLRGPPLVPSSFGQPGGDQKVTVLVIDDEQGLLDTLAAALTRFGYDVLTALDGETAIARFRQHQQEVDLVICDLVLPRVSGWEVFTEIRRLRANVPVLIVSGHLEPKLEAAVARSGAAGFLQKPFSIGTFLKRVEALAGPTQAGV